MDVLYWLRRLYSLDTLDTRFTVSATTGLSVDDRRRPHVSSEPHGTTSSDRTRNPRTGGSGSTKNGPSPSRWKTPEYLIYYLVFLVVVPMMFKVVYDVSEGRWR